MKKLLLVIVLALITLAGNAQDIIVLKDATEIQAKVESVGPTEISYHKQSNPGGPVYTIPRSQVMFIKYANGEKDVLNAVPAASLPARSGSSPRAEQVTFQGYVGLGGFVSQLSGPDFFINMGARVYNYLYVGIETGLLWFPGYNVFYIPLGCDIKGYYPVSEKFYPYAEVLLGAGIGSRAVFHSFLGVGFDARRFSMSIGYENLAGASAFGIKLGVRFGK